MQPERLQARAHQRHFTQQVQQVSEWDKPGYRLHPGRHRIPRPRKAGQGEQRNRSEEQELKRYPPARPGAGNRLPPPPSRISGPWAWSTANPAVAPSCFAAMTRRFRSCAICAVRARSDSFKTCLVLPDSMQRRRLFPVFPSESAVLDYIRRL